MTESTEVITDEDMLPPAVDFPGDIEDLYDPGWVLIRVDESGEGKILSTYGELNDDDLQYEVENLVRTLPVIEEQALDKKYPIESEAKEYKHHESLLPDSMSIDKVFVTYENWILAHIS